MADIRSRPSTDTYRDNWDRVFGRPKRQYRNYGQSRTVPMECGFCGVTVQPSDWTCFTCWPDLREDHPAAD